MPLSLCLSMIFSENRCPLFRIMLQIGQDKKKAPSKAPEDRCCHNGVWGEFGLGDRSFDGLIPKSPVTIVIIC